MTKEISSTQNPLIKQLVQLTEKSRERRKNNLFVIEGVRGNITRITRRLFH